MTVTLLQDVRTKTRLTATNRDRKEVFHEAGNRERKTGKYNKLFLRGIISLTNAGIESNSTIF